MAGVVSAAPLFEDTTPIEARLVGALDDLRKDARRGNVTEFPFRLELAGAAIDVDVRARGKSRRETCTFPPLRLDLKKRTAKGTPFEGQNKLKLVTHCRSGASFQQYVLEEYALYRVLNLLTPSSFRVRLLRLSYQQQGEAPETTVNNAFVIEDDDDVAARMGAEAVDVTSIAQDRLDERHATLVALFQYLAANTDWSMVNGPEGDSCCHNGKPVRSGEVYRVVPFDFDLAGIIRAPYAEANPDLGVRHVRDRVYRGFCVERPVLDEAIRRFRAVEQDVLGVYDTIPGLSESEIKDQKRYIERFYAVLDEPRSVERELVRSCR